MKEEKKILNIVNGIAMLQGKPFTGKGKTKRGFNKDEIEKHKEKLDNLSPEIKSGKRSFKINLPKLIEEHEIDYSYVEGKLHGINRNYYPNGQMRLECNYKDGLQNGIEKEWEENSSLRKEIEYKEGKKHGVEKVYKNGILDTQSIWKNDEMIELKAFYEDGSLNMFEEYKNGEIITSEFY